MKKLKYLLVCEGPTDIAFLKQLTNKLSQDLGGSVEIKEMSPQRDATTGNYPSHGWTGVRTWCKSWKVKTQEDLDKISPAFIKLAVRRSWPALVRMSNADGLIVQMDTDIAEKVCDLDTKYIDSDVNRREYCREAISFWLGESDHSNEKLFFLLPSYALESWLLATYPKTDPVFSDLELGFDCEKLIDVEQRLVSLGCASNTKNGVQRLRKKPHDYETYADRVYNRFDMVTDQCSEAQSYFNFLKEKISDN